MELQEFKQKYNSSEFTNLLIYSLLNNGSNFNKNDKLEIFNLIKNEVIFENLSSFSKCSSSDLFDELSMLNNISKKHFDEHFIKLNIDFLFDSYFPKNDFLKFISNKDRNHFLLFNLIQAKDKEFVIYPFIEKKIISLESSSLFNIDIKNPFMLDLYNSIKKSIDNPNLFVDFVNSFQNLKQSNVNILKDYQYNEELSMIAYFVTDFLFKNFDEFKKHKGLIPNPNFWIIQSIHSINTFLSISNIDNHILKYCFECKKGENLNPFCSLIKEFSNNKITQDKKDNFHYIFKKLLSLDFDYTLNVSNENYLNIIFSSFPDLKNHYEFSLINNSCKPINLNSKILKI